MRLAEEVICYAMSQQAGKLLLWDTGLFGKRLEGGSCLQRDEILDVVFENGLQPDRCGKLFNLTHFLATTGHSRHTDLATMV